MPCRSYCETTALPASRADVGDAAQHLQRRRRRRRDRQVGQRRQRIEPVLRRLHHDGVGDAVGRIEPVGRRDLAAAGEVDDQRVGDVARRSARHTGRACGRYRRRRPARCATAGCARRRCPAPARMRASSLLACSKFAVEVGAAHLHVDRRRRAEIQDLADDVGRQEGEGEAGEALAAAAGAARARSRRSARDPRVSLIWMSPSCGPIVPVLL